VDNLLPNQRANQPCNRPASLQLNLHLSHLDNLPVNLR
jgi:hypothetical protein